MEVTQVTLSSLLLAFIVCVVTATPIPNHNAQHIENVEPSVAKPMGTPTASQSPSKEPAPKLDNQISAELSSMGNANHPTRNDENSVAPVVLTVPAKADLPINEPVKVPKDSATTNTIPPHTGLPIIPANHIPENPFIPSNPQNGPILPNVDHALPILPNQVSGSSFSSSSSSGSFMGSQAFESSSVSVRPGPNGTVIIEVHHQTGNSPPEVTITVEKLPDHTLQVFQPQDGVYRVQPQYLDQEMLYPVNHEALRDTLEMILENEEDRDGKNLGHIINLLEEIKRRIDLFKNDIAEVLAPLNVGANGALTPAQPVIEETAKPENPTETKPEKPAEAKPEKPATSDVKPEGKPEEPSKTEDKPKPNTSSKPVEPAKPETPTKTDEKPTTPTKPEKPEDPAKPEPAKTHPSPRNTRTRRSPYRGFGGPYGGNFLGYGGAYGSLYGVGYGGGYAGGYPYYGGVGGYPYYGGYNGGFRPIYGYGGLLG
ncbi:hypothetical protein M8J77_019182 [Diaphorina citri]|nr:hypothetical protein M8J77_019182 [Diaphorina citri]